jgi:hypothetical protein
MIAIGKGKSKLNRQLCVAVTRSKSDYFVLLSQTRYYFCSSGNLITDAPGSVK